MGSPPSITKLQQTVSRLLAILPLDTKGLPRQGALELHDRTNLARVRRALTNCAQACCNRWARDEGKRYAEYEAATTAARKNFGPKPTKAGNCGHLGHACYYMLKQHNADGNLGWLLADKTMLMVTEARAAADATYDTGRDNKQSCGPCLHDLCPVMAEVIDACSMTTLDAVPADDRAY
jgi:hypothetical protein